MATPTTRPVQPWPPLLTAAHHLGETPDSLRKKLERASQRSPDGLVMAELDGVIGRKLGRLWKLRLSDAWR